MWLSLYYQELPAKIEIFKTNTRNDHYIHRILMYFQEFTYETHRRDHRFETKL